MLTLLSGLIGLLGSVIPDLLKIWNDYNDKRHELAILQIQMEHARLGHQYRMAEIDAEATSRESVALYSTQKRVGIRWVDALNATVRPFVTYLLLIWYMIYKGSFVYIAWLDDASMTIWDVLLASYTQEDMSLLALVLGFWFGHRALQRYKGLV